MVLFSVTASLLEILIRPTLYFPSDCYDRIKPFLDSTSETAHPEQYKALLQKCFVATFSTPLYDEVRARSVAGPFVSSKLHTSLVNALSISKLVLASAAPNAAPAPSPSSHIFKGSLRC